MNDEFINDEFINDELPLLENEQINPLPSAPVAYYNNHDTNATCTTCTTCTICLSDITLSSNIQETRCGHVFHTECADIWLANHNTCPLCRQVLFSEDELPVPAGRDASDYLCTCRRSYLCYQDPLGRQCATITYGIIAFLLAYLTISYIFSSYHNGKWIIDIWSIVQIIALSLFFMINFVLCTMMKCNLQFNNGRIVRVHRQQPILPI